MVVCALAGGTMEHEYLKIVQKYSVGEKGKRPVDYLADAFGRLIDIMDKTRADILGDLFQGAIAYGDRGQFFTPEWVCELMAQLTSDENGTSSARVCDPCCGSGRMLLAAASVNRNRLFVGQDADLRCVRITSINLGLRNLYGYAIWGNSLANERKLVYATGFNGKGVIRLLDAEELKIIVPSAFAAPISRESPPPVRQGQLFEDTGE